jgi:hypothetical protein
MVTTETLLVEIGDYCRRHAAAERTFGRLAVNDGKLVSTIADALLTRLARATADGALGPVAPHFFSFGGLVPTARWIRAHQAGD